MRAMADIVREQVHYRGGYKYVSAKAHRHQLMYLRDLPDCEGEFAAIQGGVLYINLYYAWDGCSGPTWDTDSNTRAGFIHDALYQMIRLGLIPAYRRGDCDKEFREICRQDGMYAFRRAAYYGGVHAFGGSSAIVGNVKPVLIAPLGRRAIWVP